MLPEELLKGGDELGKIEAAVGADVPDGIRLSCEISVEDSQVTGRGLW
jgi:hypothetical protein